MAMRDWFRGKQKPKKQRTTLVLSQEEADELALTSEEKSELDVAGGIEFRVGEAGKGPEREKFMATFRQRLKTRRDRGIPLTFEPGEMADWQAMAPGPEREAAMAREEIGAAEGGRRARQRGARGAAEVSGPGTGGLQGKIDRMLGEGYSAEQIHEKYGVWPKARPKRPPGAERTPEKDRVRLQRIEIESRAAKYRAGGMDKEDALSKAREEAATGGLEPRTVAEQAEAGMYVSPAVSQRAKDQAAARKERLRPGIAGAMARQPTPADFDTRTQAQALAALAGYPGALSAALKVYAAKGISPTLRTAAIVGIAEDPERYAEVEVAGAEGLTEADQWKIATDIASISAPQVPGGEGTMRDESVDEIHARLFGGGAAAPAAGRVAAPAGQPAAGTARAGAQPAGAAPQAARIPTPSRDAGQAVGPALPDGRTLPAPGTRAEPGAYDDVLVRDIFPEVYEYMPWWDKTIADVKQRVAVGTKDQEDPEAAWREGVLPMAAEPFMVLVQLLDDLVALGIE